MILHDIYINFLFYYMKNKISQSHLKHMVAPNMPNPFIINIVAVFLGTTWQTNIVVTVTFHLTVLNY